MAAGAWAGAAGCRCRCTPSSCCSPRWTARAKRRARRTPSWRRCSARARWGCAAPTARRCGNGATASRRGQRDARGEGERGRGGPGRAARRGAGALRGDRRAPRAALVRVGARRPTATCTPTCSWIPAAKPISPPRRRPPRSCSRSRSSSAARSAASTAWAGQERPARRQWAAGALRLHEEIKRAFDPKGLLNPGKKLARLSVGRVFPPLALVGAPGRDSISSKRSRLGGSSAASSSSQFERKPS